MAVKLPLCLYSGVIRPLQAGDILPINAIPVTYNELADLTTGLIANNQLIAGRWYLITDYRTRYLMPGTADVYYECSVEPLLVLALSANTLASIAYSTLFPQDILRYAVTDLYCGGDRGRITYREDTVLLNSLYEDYRNLVYRRWEDAPDSGQFNTLSDNGGAYRDFKVVADAITQFNNNHFGVFLDDSGNPRLGNTIFTGDFGDTIVFNNILAGAVDNTIRSYFRSNNIGTGFKRNYIEANFDYNTCGHGFQNTYLYGTNATYSQGFRQNRLAGGLSGCGVNGDVVFNTFGYSISGCDIGTGFYYNAIGNDIDTVVFDVNFQSNIVPDHTYGVAYPANTIGAIFPWLPDAPSDGNMYVRKDGAWAQLIITPPGP